MSAVSCPLRRLVQQSMSKSNVLVAFLVLEIILSLGTGGVVKRVQGQQLSVDYYNVTCPSVEQIVRAAMTAHFQQDVTVPAHLLRMQFHDCAATGCDASLLLTGTDSERQAIPNETVQGYDVIDDIKAQVEAKCPGVVSCSDVMAMAARDAVFLTQGPDFLIPLGRFDSTFSGGSNISLPSPDETVEEIIDFFLTMGLNVTELVVLDGAHTIGVAHCSSFLNRLYNFQNTSAPDPSINPGFLQTLRGTCPQGNPNNTNFEALDQQTINTFDNQFYSQMALHHGVLRLDQELFDSNLTTSTMAQLSANQTLFFELFTASLVKMGKFGVKNSTTGNIRSNCSVVGTSRASPPAKAPASSPLISPSPTNAPAPSPAIAASPVNSPAVAISPSRANPLPITTSPADLSGSSVAAHLPLGTPAKSPGNVFDYFPYGPVAGG